MRYPKPMKFHYRLITQNSQNVSENDLELLIHVLYLVNSGIPVRGAPLCLVCIVWGFVHAKKALHQLSHVPNLSPTLCVCLCNFYLLGLFPILFRDF